MNKIELIVAMLEGEQEAINRGLAPYPREEVLRLEDALDSLGGYRE